MTAHYGYTKFADIYKFVQQLKIVMSKKLVVEKEKVFDKSRSHHLRPSLFSGTPVVQVSKAFLSEYKIR